MPALDYRFKRKPSANQRLKQNIGKIANRSALEWVMDEYQVSEEKRSGIVNDPHRLDDEEYIVRLVGRVCNS